MLSIVFTLFLLAIIIWGIIKKANIATVLFFATIIGYLGLLFSGAAQQGNFFGSAFLNIFETMADSMTETMGGYILTSMSMIAYVDYMNSLKATDMFAALLAEPVKKLKYKYLVAAFAIPIGVLMGIAISGSLITITLLLGTVYPILRALGCSKPTCATAILLHTITAISPARAAYYNVLELMGLEASVPVWFIQIQLPAGAVMVAAVMMLFILTSRYFDKKEGLSEEEKEILEMKSAKQIGVPYYYAVLPLLPLVLVVVFSELVIGTIVIRVVAACLLSWCAAFAVHLVSARSLSCAVEHFEAIYQGMGTIMKTSGPIVIWGTTFAGVMTAIGGMNTLISSVSQVTGGISLLVLVGAAGLLMVSVTGTFNGNLALVYPIVKEIVAVTGIHALGAAQAIMFSLTSGAGICLVSGQNLFLAQQTDTNILTIIKRSLIPTLGGWAVSFAVCIAFF